MSHRALHLPRVIPSRQPENVVTKTPTDSPEEFYETVLSPAEARRYAIDLLNDADRAERMAETNDWLGRRKG